MPVEIKGQQLRVRIRNPKMFAEFKTHDVGQTGRLQRIAGLTKSGRWLTQAWHINLADYSTPKGAVETLRSLYEHREINHAKFNKGRYLIIKWFLERGN